jgi:hypothetical protein
MSKTNELLNVINEAKLDTKELGDLLQSLKSHQDYEINKNGDPKDNKIKDIVNHIASTADADEVKKLNKYLHSNDHPKVMDMLANTGNFDIYFDRDQ